MRIRVVGAGPGGLYFAILAKRQNPKLEIDVIEQNPDGATYGWGVVFTDAAIAALEPTAPDVTKAITAFQGDIGYMDIVTNGVTTHVRGSVFHRIGRVELLQLLEERAREAGVSIRFEERVTHLDDRADWDLVVGADGVNSVVRDLFAESFEPSITFSRNHWAWYGTTQVFPPVTLMFVEQPEGLFIGHAYQYGPAISGFVVEIGARTFDALGFGDGDDERSRRHCATVFADYLDGHELLSNRSIWFQPKFVSCGNWVHENVTLLGDALHTVHPSIGSGTRFAMRDAVALAKAVSSSGGDVARLLEFYEATRRPIADGFQRAAMRSITWYEELIDRQIPEQNKFALEFIMRTGRVPYEEFRRANPELIASYEQLA
jgi:2-polyprenyl-6-methoxyphenol hydroxylase-like FAD-dependent oxidoreductase